MMSLSKKNKILIVAFLLTLYMCYSFAIKKSIEYITLYKSQSNKIQTYSSNPKKISDLKFKEKQLDKWLTENNITIENYQNQLLKILNSYCIENNLKIVDFQEPHIFEKNNTHTISYIFSISGGFNSVLKLVNNLENNKNLGSIKNISSFKMINFKTNKEYLETQIILERKITIKM